MPRRQISTAKLLYIVMSFTSVSGYVNSAQRPFSSPFGIPELTRSTRTVKVSEKSSYDLGIGKNEPVVGVSSFGGQDETDVTEYLVEHDAVRPFPSPLMKVSMKKDNPSTNGKPKLLPKVQLERRSQDALRILHQASDENLVPFIHPTANSASLDVNTIWVEMMIHSEKAKINAALAV